MSRWRRWAVVLAALACLAPDRPPGLGDVVDVRHWTYEDYTRIVIELDRLPATEIRRLPADREHGRPERLYFDLPGIWVGRRFHDAIPVADGLLQGVRIGQNTLRTTRVVLDLASYDRHRLLQLRSPDRVVVDVYGAHRGRGDPGDSPQLPMELRPIETVVIDPGHGGKDPGAIGIGGLREKDITLELSRMLAEALQERGFKTVLTRNDDRTLTLLERTALAEGAGGDVFISVHVNAAPRRSAEGVELYTLDQNSERQTLRLAARENDVRLGEVDPLQHLLAQLRLSEVSSRSNHLARLMHRELVRDMGDTWPSVASTRLKRGPFYVLYLSDMPSILLEAGFLTHRKDAKRLRDPAYLRGLANAAADALAHYRDQPILAERRP